MYLNEQRRPSQELLGHVSLLCCIGITACTKSKAAVGIWDLVTSWTSLYARLSAFLSYQLASRFSAVSVNCELVLDDSRLESRKWGI